MALRRQKLGGQRTTDERGDARGSEVDAEDEDDRLQASIGQDRRRQGSLCGAEHTEASAAIHAAEHTRPAETKGRADDGFEDR